MSLLNGGLCIFQLRIFGLNFQQQKIFFMKGMSWKHLLLKKKKSNWYQGASFFSDFATFRSPKFCELDFRLTN